MTCRRVHGVARWLAVFALVSIGISDAAGASERAQRDQRFGSNTAFSLVATQGKKLVAAGTTDGCAPSKVSCPHAQTKLLVARFEMSGKLDRSFGRRGSVVVSPPEARFGFRPNGLGVRADGSIVFSLAGDSTAFGGVVLSLRKNGKRDRKFDDDGLLPIPPGPFWPQRFSRRALEVLPGGEIVMAGTSGSLGDGSFLLMHLDRQGDPVPGFGTAGIAELDFGPEFIGSSGGALDRQADGTLLALGKVVRASGNPREVPVVASVRTQDGSLVPEFGSGGKTVVLGDSIPTSFPLSIGRSLGGQIFYASEAVGHSVCGGGFTVASLQADGAYPGALFSSGAVSRFSPQGCSEMRDARVTKAGLIAVGLTNDPERAISVTYRNRNGALRQPVFHQISPPRFRAAATGQASIRGGQTAVAGSLIAKSCSKPYRPGRNGRCRVATLTVVKGNGAPVKRIGQDGLVLFPPGRVASKRR